MRRCLREVAVFDHPDRSQRGRTITHAHHFDLGERELPEVRADDDAAAVEWVPIAALPAMEDRFFDDHFHMLDHFLGLTPRHRRRSDMATYKGIAFPDSRGAAGAPHAAGRTTPRGARHAERHLGHAGAARAPVQPQGGHERGARRASAHQASHRDGPARTQPGRPRGHRLSATDSATEASSPATPPPRRAARASARVRGALHGLSRHRAAGAGRPGAGATGRRLRRPLVFVRRRPRAGGTAATSRRTSRPTSAPASAC